MAATMLATVNDDHQALIDAVREYARRELIELDREWDRTETSCCTHLEQLYELGLMSLRIPEEFGGLACPTLPYAAIIRELAYASPSVAVTVGVHNMVAEAINRFGSPDLRRQILPVLATTGNLAAFAISEPNVGSDPGSARARAIDSAGGWKLIGNKMWVTNGITGRWFIVLCRVGDANDKRSLSMMLLNAEQPGVTRQIIHGKMGIRGSETAEMALEEALAPREHLLGKIGDGLRIGLTALDSGRIGIASQAAGIALACVDLMIDYARQREQFGRPIADFQAIQWMIADSVTELAAANGLIDHAAMLKDADQPFTQQAAMAKLYASEMANRVAYRAVQVHGGSGFVNDCRVEQLYRDARITTIYEGTSEIQRLVIARNALSPR